MVEWLMNNVQINLGLKCTKEEIKNLPVFPEGFSN